MAYEVFKAARKIDAENAKKSDEYISKLQVGSMLLEKQLKQKGERNV